MLIWLAVSEDFVIERVTAPARPPEPAGAFIGFHLGVIFGLLPSPLILSITAIIGALVVLWVWRGR